MSGGRKKKKGKRSFWKFSDSGCHQLGSKLFETLQQIRFFSSGFPSLRKIVEIVIRVFQDLRISTDLIEFYETLAYQRGYKESSGTSQTSSGASEISAI